MAGRWVTAGEADFDFAGVFFIGVPSYDSSLSSSAPGVPGSYSRLKASCFAMTFLKNSANVLAMYYECITFHSLHA
jgi:hypothetical protein